MRRDPHDSDEEDFRNDPLVRIAAVIMDPSHGRPVPPTSVTAGQLIQMARQRRHAARRRLMWTAAPAIVAVVVVVVIVAAADFFSGYRQGTPVAYPARSTSPMAHAPSRTAPVPLRLPAARPVAARGYLAALASRARACGDRAVPARYTYLHFQTSTPDAPAVRDEQLWWAADHSGRQVVAEASTGTAAPTYGSVGDYRPGELAVVVDNPSTDPPILASQLARYQPMASGAWAPLRAVVDLYRYHALDAAHRAAAIRILVDTNGLEYRGAVSDPAGRDGVAITVDSDHGLVRDVAVFHPTTGQLLSYERQALRRAGGAAVGIVDYLVLLASGSTDHLDEAGTMASCGHS